MEARELIHVVDGMRVFLYKLVSEVPVLAGSPLMSAPTKQAKAGKKPDVKKATKKAVKRGGRPKGSKNKPKPAVAIAPATTQAPDTQPEAAVAA